MASQEKQHKTLFEILSKSTIKLVCPQCLEGFPRVDRLNGHFRSMKDDIHQGLLLLRKDFKKFHDCYQRALRSSIAAEKIPQRSQELFDFRFIVEHYGENETCGNPDMSSGTGPISDGQLDGFNSDAMLSQDNLFSDNLVQYHAPTLIDRFPLSNMPETGEDILNPDVTTGMSNYPEQWTI
ncbi:conserved hypothetical protein [Talaromyces stipitatus ATCC 10500]|uniref:Uncharacterized protein n=1 Tax=Talaromyces stipitatus (strain ATCC 10500 / CBS 375.48 / QM 6759 / NRRL 1006) TaxID=441959 RepID=B8MUI7_TALSN|nr:uncharacterized protein TSTA_108420 [Talaromyces stipitatus ATCC 10500]EED11655.1 conserved hypothetical protein [Talaromyces stipitatus ATCC 10500]